MASRGTTGSYRPRVTPAAQYVLAFLIGAIAVKVVFEILDGLGQVKFSA
jgi:hypothetical protein